LPQVTGRRGETMQTLTCGQACRWICWWWSLSAMTAQWLEPQWRLAPDPGLRCACSRLGDEQAS